MHTIFFVVTLLLVAPPLLATSKSHQYRRILHQPLFPLDQSLPPTPLPTPQPPFASPSPQPQQQQQPKYPFSYQSPPTTTTTPQTQDPFFPFYPSQPPPPPPPSSVSLTTFPANISSLILPQSPSSSSKPLSRKLVAIIVSVSLVSAAFIAAIAAFVLHHKQRNHHLHLHQHQDKEHHNRTDSLRLFPPNATPSDAATTTTISKKPPPPAPPLHHHSATSTSSEFLYLGTLVSSREVNEHSNIINNNTDNNVVAYHRLESPELRPLPPLPRQHSRQNSKNNTTHIGGSDDEEEFYSPRGSSGDKDSSHHTESSPKKKAFDALESEKFQNKATDSHFYTNFDSPMHSSSSSPSVVLVLSPTSLTTKSPDSLVNFPAPPRFIPQPPPPRERRALSSSPPSSRDTQNSPSRVSDFSSLNPESPVGKPGGSVKLHPPPPPPPPPVTFWEAQMPVGGGRGLSLGPPELVAPSRPVSGERKDEEFIKPKLKPLHWDKVRASSDRAMVWDQLKSSSFQVNEEMIETLFMVNSSNINQKDGNRRPTTPGLNQENRVLDPKKSQNIAILLRALNVTTEEVCEALLEGSSPPLTCRSSILAETTKKKHSELAKGNADTLGAELLESLIKMSPSKEEEQKLVEFKDESPFKLGPAEKFLKAVLGIPFAFKRVDAMLYVTNFDSEVEYLKRSFETLEAACKELKNSRMFLKLLEAVLKTGNRMNVGTNRGDAHAFKLDTLLKLVDVKGTDGKTTLLHFVVHEIIRAEGSRLSSADKNPNAEKNQQSDLRDEIEFRKIGLQVVSGLSGELTNVKKAAAMDSDVLISEVAKLATGISKITVVLKLNGELALKDTSKKFSESMHEFLRKAKEEITNIQVQESRALSMVKEITEYFHGDSSKEEAHRFRIFVVVRDFLYTLDQVCKDVGKINERTIVGTGRQIPVSVNPSLPQVFPGLNGRQEQSSSDDETSSSSCS